MKSAQKRHVWKIFYDTPLHAPYNRPGKGMQLATIDLSGGNDEPKPERE